MALTAEGIHPVLSRIYAARGIDSLVQLQTGFTGLIAPERMQHIGRMAQLLADAIEQKRRLLIVADYDSDGATACAVGIRALRSLGGNVEYLVPNRFEHGYGLTPEIVRLAAERKPDFIVTVDNGIASVEGVAEANRLGIQVLVTDHHLPGDALPDAACIVNPNAPGCGFPSKNLAGVGVIFYVMLALRAEMRKRGCFDSREEPNFTELMDLVALGTVADVVRLDENNRILVEQGLRRIRAGKACAGLQALLRVAGRDARRASTYDLGFVVGPRLNAAGRLEDMELGIACLTTDDPDLAQRLSEHLDEINRSRREIESEMQESALASLEGIEVSNGFSLTLYDDQWHQGVIGILASRMKERFHRPTIVFARAGDGKIKGSGRSIAGLHLRDALDLVSKRAPDVLLSFGGHAMAAGVSLMEANFDRFSALFEQVASEQLTPADLEQILETDGLLNTEEHTMQLAQAIETGVWGQGFPAPTFYGDFVVAEQRIVGERHLKLKLRLGDKLLNAMLFFRLNCCLKRSLRFTSWESTNITGPRVCN